MNKTMLKLHQRVCVAKAVESTLGFFCYPTGTGKTLAEAHIIIEHIKKNSASGVYVVLVPRIMLAEQIFSEVWKEVVLTEKIDCSFFSLHSGKSPDIKKMTKKMRLKDAFDDQDDQEDARQVYDGLKALGLSDQQLSENFESSTSASKLLIAANKAQSNGRPLIVVSTYHSSERLIQAFGDSGQPIKVLIADEGHNAVSLGFTHVHDIPSEKRFYFTATLKFTDGAGQGLGMQNESKFGVMLDSLSPAEAVIRGLIVRPRIHYVEIDGVTDDTAVDADSKSIEAAFIAHAKAVGGIGAKLLVASRGTLNIKQIMEHSKNFARLRAIRPNLKVFDISSLYGARINGVKVERSEFLSTLQNMKDAEEAIIIHYDILSEGIDVPGITGVMPLRALGTSKFLQTLGRATRLHLMDRKRLSDEETSIEEAAKLDWFVKPCAWLVLPCYGTHGQEIQASAEMYVQQLRTFGWIPGEDDLLTEAGGELEPTVIGDIHPGSKKKIPNLVEMMGEINQRFEDMERAVNAYNEYKKLDRMAQINLLLLAGGA